MLKFDKVLKPFEKTQILNSLMQDYVRDNEFLRDFYAYEDNMNGLEDRIKSYFNPRLNRSKLKEVLLKQYDSYSLLSLHTCVHENILSLQGQNTFTISTGHQLNIFSSPVFIIYKLISVINLTEKLKTVLPGYNFVPVYWMASEDHDVNEIASLNLFGKKYMWENEWKGITGDMPLDHLQELFSEIKGSFSNSAFAEDLISIVNSSYFSSKTLGEATRKWIHNLFGKFGVVTIDGNDDSLKQSFSDIIIDELDNQKTSDLINDTKKKLEEKYKPGVNPREINLFYLSPGSRDRIIKDGIGFSVMNTDQKFTVNQMHSLVETNPGRFSPNVVLRPLYEECILPNIAYIGGPAEISYWLELKQVFDHYKVPMPVLFLRDIVLVLDKTITGKLNKLLIDESDLFQSSDQLIRDYLMRDTDNSIFEKITESVSEGFSGLKSEIIKIDPTLAAAVEAEHQKTLSSLKSLNEKMLRAKKKKSETAVSQISKLKDKLFPSGKLQEREEAFISFYLRWGNDFIDELKRHLDPLEKEIVILKEVSEQV